MGRDTYDMFTIVDDLGTYDILGRNFLMMRSWTSQETKPINPNRQQDYVVRPIVTVDLQRTAFATQLEHSFDIAPEEQKVCMFKVKHKRKGVRIKRVSGAFLFAFPTRFSVRFSAFQMRFSRHSYVIFRNSDFSSENLQKKP